MHRHNLTELPLDHGRLEDVVGEGNVLGGKASNADGFDERTIPALLRSGSVERLGEFLFSAWLRLPENLRSASTPRISVERRKLVRGSRKTQAGKKNLKTASVPVLCLLG